MFGKRTGPGLVRVMEKRSEKQAGLGDGERLLLHGLEGHSKDLGALGSSFLDVLGNSLGSLSRRRT